jgi:hypothetical protein
MAKELREHGGWQVKMILQLDAYSVFSAVTALNVKAPADCSLYAHVQYLRQLLDEGVLDQIWWVDTRDMCADALTKGGVERDAMHDIMNGVWKIMKNIHAWRSAFALRSKEEASLVE